MKTFAFCLAFLCSSSDLVSMDRQQKIQPRPDQIYVTRKLVRSIRCLETRKQKLEGINTTELSIREQEKLRVELTHICISLECQTGSLEWVRNTYEVSPLTRDAEEELDALETQVAQLEGALWVALDPDKTVQLDALKERIDFLYKN